ncbi:MAG: YlbF family regulator [Clostridia bacterium]|nr:YlbF family regulator [Clostridia bacterium]
MDEIIAKAKELGEAISNSDIMKEYIKKEIEYNADPDAQKATQEYNQAREKLAGQAKDENISPMEMLEIRKQLAGKFEQVSKQPKIAEYLKAKKQVEEVLEKVNSIIRYYVTGETEEEGCSGNCSSCGGCH